MHKDTTLNIAILTKIDEDLKLTSTLNPEIKQRWYPLGIRMGYTAVVEPAHTMISSVGRAKYLTPIYKALLDTNQIDLAKKWYQENIDFYHPYVVYQIGKMIDDAEKT